MEVQLREIVSRIAEISNDFSRQASLRDELNVDSFRSVEIVFEVERAFAVKVPDARFGKVQTFDELLQLVTDLKAA